MGSRALLFGVLLVALAACGDEPTASDERLTPPGDTLADDVAKQAGKGASADQPPVPQRRRREPGDEAASPTETHDALARDLSRLTGDDLSRLREKLLLDAAASVPGLLHVLQQDDARARMRAIRLLAQMKHHARPAVAALAEIVASDPLEHLREEALTALGEIGGEAAMSAVVGLLESDDEDTVVLGIHALQDFGPEAKVALPKLVAILADAEAENAQIVLDTVREMGADAAPVVPALIGALDRDGAPTEEILEALIAIGPAASDARPAILRAMVAHNRGVREYMESNPEVDVSWAPIGMLGAEALAAFGESSIPYLMEALGHEERGLRFDAVDGLRAIGEPALEPLKDALRSENPRLRAGAVEALGALLERDAAGLALLSPALRDPVLDVRISALDAVYAWRAEAVPLLLQGMADPGTRARSAQLLGFIGADAAPAVPRLTEALADADLDTRLLSAEAIGKIGPQAAPAAEALGDLLSAQNQRLRSRAAAALTLIGEDGGAVLLQVASGGEAPQSLEALEALRSADVDGEHLARVAVPLLNSADPDARLLAAVVLGTHDAAHGAAAPFLIAAVRGPQIQPDAKLGLESFGTACEGLAGYSTEPAESIDAICAGIIVLKAAAEEGALPRKTSWRSRPARKALGRLATRSPEPLLAHLGTDDADLRAFYADALGDVDKSIAEAVFAFASSAENALAARLSATRVLGSWCYPKTGPRDVLAKLFDDPSSQVRYAALVMYVRTTAPTTAHVLSTAMDLIEQTEDTELRRRCAKLLATKIHRFAAPIHDRIVAARAKETDLEVKNLLEVPRPLNSITR